MKIPVSILTGFLGSGKTTVLNQMVRANPSHKIMVIENEVGQVNIDGALVESGVEDVIELTAGCLCCSLSDGLLDALELVSERQDEFDHLVIETTGVADPSSIVQIFLTDPMVERVFELRQVLCVVDAGLIEDWLEETEEALRQIAMSNVILINKTDTVSERYLSELKQKMNSVNPFAHLFFGENGQFPFDEIMELELSNTILIDRSNEIVEDHRVQNNNSEFIGHQHGVNSFTLTFEDPFELNDYFSLQLYRIVNFYRDQVYRLKGILYVSGYPNRVILQSVRTSCVITDGNPWKEGEEKMSQLVFIGRGLQKDSFYKMFKQFTKTIIHEPIKQE